MTIWDGLLVNLAIMVIVAVVWTQTYGAIQRIKPWQRTMAFAAMFAFGVIAVMTRPFQLQPGVLIDLRTTLVVLGGLFGGAAVALSTAAVAIAYRVLIGGAGAAQGIMSLVAAFLIGAIGGLAIKGRAVTSRHVVTIAGVSAVGLPVMWILTGAPPTATTVLSVWLPIVAITLTATIAIGLLMSTEVSRLAAARLNELFVATINELPNPLNVKDTSGRFVIANPATAAMMGADDVGSLLGRSDFDFYPKDVAASFRVDDERVLREGISFTKRQRADFADGSFKWLKTTKAPFHDATGALVGLITQNIDVTERQAADEEHEEVRHQLAEVLGNMNDGLVVFNRDDRIILCNAQYQAMFPQTADVRVPGTSFPEILRAAVARGEETPPPGMDFDAWFDKTCAEFRLEGTREVRLNDGRTIEARVKSARDGTVLSLMNDVSATKAIQSQLLALNEKLEALARADGLTGLLNRRAFDDALAREFLRSVRTETPLSVALVDVDHFKAYNDTYGHPQGDECLRAVGQCLRETLKRPGDVAARYGGEEFVAVLPDTDASGAAALAETFRASVRDLKIPHSGSPKGIVTVTVGVASRIPDANDIPGDVVRRADKALYLGKTGGRDQVCSAPVMNRPMRLVAS